MRDHEEAPSMLPPPLTIAPEELSSTELEAGVDSSSPGPLLQEPRTPHTTKSTSGLARSPLPRQPQPSLLPFRKVVCDCASSDPKGKRRVRQQCTGCIGWVLRSVCCLLLVGIIILHGLWSLFPLNTACDTTAAVEIAATQSTSAEDSVRPFSTLRINQLQVMHS